MENKKEFERFAALYWGQKVGIDSLNPNNLTHLFGKILSDGSINYN